MLDGLLIAVLAAGGSRRLGQPKQLVELGGEPLLRRQCRIALESQLGRVTVILGCHKELCATAVADLCVEARVNHEWKEGLAASLRIATRAAMEQNVAGLLVLHCDQYRVTAEDLRALRAAWADLGRSMACRSCHESYVGPPAILPASCFAGLLKLTGDEGARRIFDEGGAIDVPMPSAVYDLDLPSQLEAFASGSID